MLLLRGCAIAGQETEEPLPIPEDISAVIAVYDDENDCVRSMPLEEYLCGVVAAEMPASFEPKRSRRRPSPHARSPCATLQPAAERPVVV